MAFASVHDAQRCSFSQFHARFSSSPCLHPHRRIRCLVPFHGPKTLSLEIGGSCLLYRWPEMANALPPPPRGMIWRVRAGASTAKRRVFYPGESKGLVEEMRFVAMKLHKKDRSEQGEKDDEEKPEALWKPSIQGYLKFLVDSKAVYDAMEGAVDIAVIPSYAEFRNTGLERAGPLAKDLKWLKRQGHVIPRKGEPGLSYSRYLKNLAETDAPAFLSHFYSVYFAHSAGGLAIGTQVADKILNRRKLEFYKWDGDPKIMFAGVKRKLNKVAEGWTREEKDRCLKETEKSLKNSAKILRLIVL